jgi:gamma-glutamylcyclotransferase (GGCT)/AIG2-like uncharacterized protein YtfP
MRSARSSTTGDSPFANANANASGANEANGNLFVYGTLLLPAVIEALIGRVPDQLPATLLDYRRYRLAGKVFPAITSEPNARVDGLVYRGLDPQELMIVDAFESSIYTRRRVDAQTLLTQVVTADAYVLADGNERMLQQAPPWLLDDFAAHSGPRYIRMCAEFRSRWQPAR